MDPKAPDEFEKAAQNHGKGNIVIEFWLFLRANKKWWLLPIVIIMLLLSVLIYLAMSPAAPFIYTLF